MFGGKGGHLFVQLAEGFSPGSFVETYKPHDLLEFFVQRLKTSSIRF